VAGKVHLVGAGPGDPGLLTLRAAQLVGRADVILHDRLIDPRVLELARPGAQVVEVAKTPGLEHPGQDAINARMIADARAGLEVVRLKGGDPFLFARGSEEAQALAAAGVDFDVVPGISSPVATAAYAGIPLTHRDHASSVLILTGHGAADGAPPVEDVRRAAGTRGTIVILMGMRHLAPLTAALVEGGRPAGEPVAIVRWASRPEQKTVITTLARAPGDAAAAGLTAPAVIVVGSVVSLRATISWFEKLPLFGKRVLVPRAVDQSGGLATLLGEAGADTLEVPAIRIAPPADLTAVRTALAALPETDLVVFASTNAVEWFFRYAAEAKLDARCLGRARVCAVGPATAEALAEHGIVADIVPSTYRAEAAARAIVDAAPVRGLRVLVPRAEAGRDVLPAALREAGAIVDAVAFYRTLPPDDTGVAALRDATAACDAIVLTSGSTAENLSAALGPDAAALVAGKVIASIGPVTTEAARAAGLEPTLTANEATMPGVVRALCEHFGGQTS
jgi:uroporphyrinogen III methyltransferase/synthase